MTASTATHQAPATHDAFQTLPPTLLLRVAAMLTPQDALALREASRATCQTMSSREADAVVWAPAVAVHAASMAR